MELNLDCTNCGCPSEEGTASSTTTATGGHTGCSDCSGGIAECWEFAIAGVSDGYCVPREDQTPDNEDCTGFNRTINLRRQNLINSCLFLGFFDAQMCNSVSNQSAGMNLRELPAEEICITELAWILSIQGDPLGGGAAIYHLSTGTTGFNCFSANVFDLCADGEDEGGNPLCVGWPESITVTPVTCPSPRPPGI
jgi:hypothetical protein